MRNTRLLIVAVVVVAFLAVGGFLIARNVGGGGQSRSIALQVTGNTMTPSRISAKQGDTLTITVTADKAEEIHLHGYDIPFEVPTAGGNVSHTFKADKTGTFEIEIEETSKTLGFLDVKP
jgi:hypothetical protein